MQKSCGIFSTFAGDKNHQQVGRFQIIVSRISFEWHDNEITPLESSFSRWNGFLTLPHIFVCEGDKEKVGQWFACFSEWPSLNMLQLTHWLIWSHPGWTISHLHHQMSIWDAEAELLFIAIGKDKGRHYPMIIMSKRGLDCVLFEMSWTEGGFLLFFILPPPFCLPISLQMAIKLTTENGKQKLSVNKGGGRSVGVKTLKW